MLFRSVNSIAGGAVGGSVKIWTYKKINLRAAKYDSLLAFRTEDPLAYAAARRAGITKDVSAHMKRLHTAYTKDQIRDAALLYETRGDFLKYNKRLYYAAWGRGMLDDFCGHMICGSARYWKKRHEPAL